MELEFEELLPWLLMAVIWAVVLTRAARGKGLQGFFRSSELAGTDSDVARLRNEVDRLSAQVDRLVEEQSFMLRLLSEGDRRRLEARRDDTEPLH